MSDGAGWFPVALAAGLDPGTSAGTRLHGRELVVWRDDAGAAHVWEDRCPHRGMRLSFGFVRGDHIACLYHGWRFDGAGQCRFIPAHPKLDVPDTIKVVRYPSAERLGIVWVKAGPALAPEPPQAPEPAPGDNAEAVAVRSITVLAPEAVVLAAIEAEGARLEGGRTGPLFRVEPEGRVLVVAAQPLDAAETCLHIALLGPPEADRASARPAVSRWAEAVRRRAEADFATSSSLAEAR